MRITIYEFWGRHKHSDHSTFDREVWKIWELLGRNLESHLQKGMFSKGLGRETHEKCPKQDEDRKTA